MPPRILNLCFPLNFKASLVLVLEPCADEWQMIYTLAADLVQTLPGQFGEVRFLGQRQSYLFFGAKDFRDKIPGWWADNKNRVSLLGPVLEDLQQQGFQGLTTVVCSKPPVDLDDWKETPALRQTLFLKVGETSFPDYCWVMEANKVEPRMVEALTNPPLEITVQGQGFVPLAAAFQPPEDGSPRIFFRDGGFVMEISISSTASQLHVQALCLAEAPWLRVKRAMGQIEDIAGHEESAWFQEPTWKKLTATLQPIVAAGVTRTDYLCPQCHSRHLYSELLCPEGDLVLKDLPLNTCLLFTRDAYLSLTEELYAFPLNKGEKVIARDGRVYRALNGSWQDCGPVEPFKQVDDNVWALYHHL